MQPNHNNSSMFIRMVGLKKTGIKVPSCQWPSRTFGLVGLQHQLRRKREREGGDTIRQFPRLDSRAELAEVVGGRGHGVGGPWRPHCARLSLDGLVTGWVIIFVWIVPVPPALLFLVVTVNEAGSKVEVDVAINLRLHRPFQNTTFTKLMEKYWSLFPRQVLMEAIPSRVGFATTEWCRHHRMLRHFCKIKTVTCTDFHWSHTFF